MFKLIYKFFTSPFFKILFKFVASLASAIAVISGFLFFVNMNTKNRQDEIDDDDDDEIELEDETN